MFLPPRGELLAHFHKARLNAGLALDERADGGAVGERGGKVHVAADVSRLTYFRFRRFLNGSLSRLTSAATGSERVGGVEAEGVEEWAFVRHFSNRHAAKEMGAHVVGFGRW